MRRTIITILNSADQNGISYTELITELGLPTGKMNYHLEQLEGLIEKNNVHRYVLTSLGKKAVNQLKQLHLEINEEDRRYLYIAEKSQNRSIEPTVKAFIIIGIAGCLMVFAVLAILTYVVATENDTPLFVYILLPAMMAIDIAVVVTLIRTLKSAPRWLKGIERKFIETL